MLVESNENFSQIINQTSPYVVEQYGSLIEKMNEIDPTVSKHFVFIIGYADDNAELLNLREKQYDIPTYLDLSVLKLTDFIDRHIRELNPEHLTKIGQAVSLANLLAERQKQSLVLAQGGMGTILNIIDSSKGDRKES